MDDASMRFQLPFVVRGSWFVARGSWFVIWKSIGRARWHIHERWRFARIARMCARPSFQLRQTTPRWISNAFSSHRASARAANAARWLPTGGCLSADRRAPIRTTRSRPMPSRPLRVPGRWHELAVSRESVPGAEQTARLRMLARSAASFERVPFAAAATGGARRAVRRTARPGYDRPPAFVRRRRVRPRVHIAEKEGAEGLSRDDEASNR